MGRIKIEALVQIYEINGEDVPIGIDYPQMTVKRHWCWSQERVVLKVGKEQITVLKKDLIDAIRAVTV